MLVKKILSCNECSLDEFKLFEKEFSNGTIHVAAHCSSCGKHKQFIKQEEEGIEQMAITKNIGGGGKFISEPGEYKVEVGSVQLGKSKKGDPMLTIGFTTDDEKSINAYFVRSIPFMMAHLNLLKIACGIKPDQSSDDLLGRRCGISVELGKPNEKGNTFAQIVGYGREDEVENTPSANGSTPDDTDHIPF